MGERLVGFGHSVHIFALLDCPTFAGGSSHQLSRELLGHRLIRAFIGVVDKPSDCKSGSPLGTNFCGYLIGSTTYSTCTHFQQRRCIMYSFLEYIERSVFRLLFDQIERRIEDLTRRLFLPPLQEGIDKPRNKNILKLWIGRCIPFCSSLLSHARTNLDYAFGRLAPYLDRPCLRSCTP